jgi:hypothetical protein
MSRRFTIVEVSNIYGSVKGRENLGGIFTNRTPIEAAKKAASRICRLSKIHGRCTLIITIREITRNSAQKEYTYKIKRHRVDRTVIKDGQAVHYKYAVYARSLNQIA